MYVVFFVLLILMLLVLPYNTSIHLIYSSLDLVVRTVNRDQQKSFRRIVNKRLKLRVLWTIIEQAVPTDSMPQYVLVLYSAIGNYSVSPAF